MKITYTEELFSQRCPTCMVHFAYPEALRASRQETGGDLWCPNGHCLSYAESIADRLRRERDRLTQRLAEKDDEIIRQRGLREAAEHSASAARDQVTKLKKRAAGGACPCCNRSFTNLRRHMESKHPTFGADETNVVPLKVGNG